MWLSSLPDWVIISSGFSVSVSKSMFQPEFLTRSLLLIPFVSLALASHTHAQSEPELEGSSWQLVEIRGFNNTVYTPQNAEDYLLRFRASQRLQIEADCNQAGATWTVEGTTLSLTELVTTRKLCTAPSLFNRYIMHLGNVISAEQSGDRLVLRAEPGAVELEFEPYVFTPQF